MAELNVGVPGAQVITSPNGNEYIEVVGGAVKVVMKAQAVANLARGSGSFQSITALNSVGAGSITAAGVVGGTTSRGGSQTNTAFTDTLPLGTAIEALLTNPQTGQSFFWSYKNGTNANATLSSATGTTVSVITTVYSGCTARFLVTRTAANTYTVVGIEQTAPLGASGTFVMNGTTAVTVADTRLTANSVVTFGLSAVGGTVGAYPSVKTVTPGTGFTVAGTAADTSTYSYQING